MEQLFQEFVTQKSLGGSLLMAIFFFTTYVVAVVFWNDQTNLDTPEGETCSTLRNCYMTMLRLVVYDGTGFDYLNSLVNSPEQTGGYVLLLFIFMIFNGIVLINGLIGIFGSTFTTQDERVEQTYEKLNQVEGRLEKLTSLVENYFNISSNGPGGNGFGPGNSGGGASGANLKDTNIVVPVTMDQKSVTVNSGTLVPKSMIDPSDVTPVDDELAALSRASLTVSERKD